MGIDSRFEQITLWTQNGLNQEGFPAWNTPVTKTVRWEDRVVLIKNQQTGDMLSSNSRVWFGEDITDGSYVYRGISVDTAPPSDARRVIRFVKIGNVDNTKFERVAYLD